MIMVPAIKPKIYTPEEYLELEVGSVDRHTYIDGEIILMPGGTPNHNLIIGNLSANLNFTLKHQSYFVFASDQRLWIPQKRIYTYPDVMVVQEAIQLQEGRKDTIINPIMIAEILSKSTQQYDQGEKFKAYRTIPSVQEYVLIDQYSMHVEKYVKTGSSQWLFSEYDGATTFLGLETVPVEISLADLYAKVEFELDEEESL
jgi:Uma2 family endonuclease